VEGNSSCNLLVAALCCLLLLLLLHWSLLVQGIKLEKAVVWL